MNALPLHMSPEAWLAQIFSAKAVNRGGVVRRSVAWIEAEIGRERMVAAVRRRGFHMVECGGQIVVICNAGGLMVVC